MASAQATRALEEARLDTCSSTRRPLEATLETPLCRALCQQVCHFLYRPFCHSSTYNHYLGCSVCRSLYRISLLSSLLGFQFLSRHIILCHPPFVILFLLCLVIPFAIPSKSLFVILFYNSILPLSLPL